MRDGTVAAMNPFLLAFTFLVAVMGFLANGGQLWRMRRHGNEGVSSWTWTLIATSGFCWAVDLTVRGIWLTGMVDAGLALVAVGVASRAKSHHRLWQVCAGAAAVAVIAGLAVTSPTGSAVVLSCVTVAIYLPQFISAVRRTLRGGSNEGVAVGTWVLNTIMSVLWVGWGVSAGLAHAIVANLVLAVMALVVSILSYRSHVRERVTIQERPGPVAAVGVGT